MDENIKVSICCLVYNHENSLRRCLDGFVNQETNFKFEIVIHDDASTDNSKQIIEEYVSNYPNIIIPIYEDENVYSKNIPIIENIMIPKARGKYITFCEGDDYWCDNSKLQKQFDYMEKHSECSMCVHHTYINNLITSEKKLFNDWKEIHKMTEEEVFLDWKVHTSSYFILKEAVIIPEELKNYWFGDYVILTVAFAKGEIHFLPYIMSVYNFDKSGVTYAYAHYNVDNALRKVKARKEYLEKYNRLTNGKFDKIINKRIIKIELDCIFLRSLNIRKYKEYKELKNEINKNKDLKMYIKDCSLKKRIKFKVKYQNYIFFKLINLIKKKEIRK